jgi:hypothetical protein
VDSPGDNLLAEFSSVVDAVQSAVAIQKELTARNTKLPENRMMHFRIGINIGDVIEDEDRIYGDGVNIAARLEGLAEPGGICLSRMAFDQIESKLPLGYEYIGEHKVKNINKPLHAYRVVTEKGAQAQTRSEPGHTNRHEKAGGADESFGGERVEHTYHHVKGKIRDFAEDLSKDEQIGKTFEEIKEKVRGFADDVGKDPERRHRAVHEILDKQHVRAFLGISALILVINLLTSFGRWWFQYPVASIGLIFYLNRLRVSFFSSEKVKEMRTRMLPKALAQVHEKVGDREDAERLAAGLVEERIRFYRHLYIYVGVNAYLILLNLITSPLSWWFPFPLVCWGLLLFFHWLKMSSRAHK